MRENWTRKEVKTVLVNLMNDSDLFTRTEMKNLNRLTFTLQELATLLGQKIDALKDDKKRLEKQVRELTAPPDNTLFPLGKFTVAPPDFQAAYRREFLGS